MIRRSWIPAWLCILWGAFICANPLWAQRTTGLTPTTGTAGQEDTTEAIAMTAGQTRILDAPWPVRRVSVNDPAIADVDVPDPRHVQIIAKAPGSTDLVLWSENGQNWRARIDVEADLRRLQGQLQKMFPGAALEVSQFGNIVVLKGVLPLAENVPQLRKFMELSKIQYIDATTVASLQQVQLQVKIAEVSRSAVRALGINAVYSGNDWFGGIQLGSSAAPFVPLNAGIPNGALAGTGNVPFQFLSATNVPTSATVFAGFPGSDLEFFIQALAENQYLQLLAEPTLVARSGQEASFLVGGEFPIPISQVGGGTTEISIEYKEFGTRLRFRPDVLGDGRINLHVMPEISELSDVGAVEVFGTRVPSVLSRRVETTLELRSGQTCAIGGLINRADNARVSKIPGLGDLPLVGSLFRSTRYSQADTEMVVLVTVSLIDPISTERTPPLPGLLHEAPNSWELYIEGRLDHRRPPPLSPPHAEQLKRLGFHQLRGPGGWAMYERPVGALAGEQ